MNKYLCEFIGTFFLVFTIGNTVIGNVFKLNRTQQNVPTDVATAGDFITSGTIEQTGVGANWNFRLSSQTASNVGVNVSRNGNTPTNVPHVVWNLTPSQRIGALDISATLRQVGARWSDTANTRRVGSYTTLDMQVGYRFVKGTRVRVRGRNLADKIYTPSVSLTSGRLEAPRSFDVTITKGF